MAISLLKGLLAASGLTLSTSPITSIASTFVESDKVVSPEESLFKMIKNSASPIAVKTEWEYDGQKFYSQQDLDNYIVENNKIEIIQTSSNPTKIVNDYQLHTLYADQIYDTNFANYQLVYRDAFGNASLSKEDTLKTFTNQGLVKPQYSYDALNWYDSPEEAKAGYIYRSGLRKSLYYYVDGRYYNVFNGNDQQALRNILTEGYSVKASNFTGGTQIYGTRESLHNLVQDYFRGTWTNSNGSSDGYPHYAEHLRSETTHSILISPGNDNLIKINKSVNGGPAEYTEYWPGSTAEIEDPEKKFSEADFRESSSGWKRNLQCDDNEWSCSTGKYYYQRVFVSGNNSYDITYLPIDSNGGWSPADFLWAHVATSQSYASILRLYDKAYGTTNAHEIFTWENIPLNITKSQEIPTQYVREAYDIWFNYFYDQEFLALNKVDTNGVKYNDYGVSADLLYDVNGRQGYKYSLQESTQYYRDTLKPEILAGPTKTNTDGVLTYELRDDFYATQTELDNYLFLIGLDARPMYTYLDEQDVSSQDGLALASTEAEAREKQFQYEAHVLQKKYFAYDVFGNSIVSGESAADAVAKLQKSISLNGKYINVKEIESWDNGVYTFENIIQDGIYNVFRIYSQARVDQGLDPYLYFDSFNAALTALKANIYQITNMTTTIVNIYLYIYIDKNNNKHSYTYTSDEEIEAIVAEIMELN